MEWEILTEDEIKAMDKEVTSSIKAAMEEADKSPEPSPDSVYDYVYKDDPYVNKR